MNNEKSNVNTTFLAFLLILIVGFFTYANTFKGEFIFDDLPTITENHIIRDFPGLQAVYKLSPTRFLPNLTFALNFKLADIDVTYYHLFNLTLHVINAFLVFLLARLIFECLFPSGDSNRRFFFPLTVSLVFLLHPLQTQAVAYITQRYTLVAAFFYLACLYTYLTARIKKSWLFYLFSLSLLILALLSKEISFSLPFTIALCEFTFIGQGKKNILKRSFFILPFFLIAFFIYLFVFRPSPEKGLIGSLPAAKQGLSITRSEYLFTQLNVMMTYLRLLVIPINQNLDYDFPITRNFLNLPTIFSFLFLFGLIIIAIKIFKKNKIIAFSIFFFFITILPESSIIPIIDLANEHRLYLPMFVFGMFFAGLVFGIFDQINKLNKLLRNAYIFSLVAIFCLLAILTYQRNKVWQNRFTLWSDTVMKSPYKARPHYNLAMAYLERKEPQKGIEEFKKAIEIDPGHEEAYNNLGVALVEFGQIDKGIETYLKGLYFVPLNAMLHANLGTAYFKKGDLDQAFWEYKKALAMDKSNLEAYTGLGIFYLQKKKPELAMAEFKQAIGIDKNYLKAYLNLAMTYEQIGKKNEAIEVYQRVLELDPGNAGVKERLRLLIIR